MTSEKNSLSSEPYHLEPHPLEIFFSSSKHHKPKKLDDKIKSISPYLNNSNKQKAL